MSRSPNAPEKQGPAPPFGGGSRQLVIIIILLSYLMIVFGGVLALGAYLSSEDKLTATSGVAVAAIAAAGALAAKRMTAAFISLLQAIAVILSAVPRGGAADGAAATG